MQAAAERPELRPPQEADETQATAVLHALRAVRDLLSGIERNLLGETTSPGKPRLEVARLLDDSIVDQRTAPVPKDLYLRLARAGAFPSRRIGKRIVAAWSDVRAAFLGGQGVRKAPADLDSQESTTDDLNDLRRQIGLIEKGK